MKKILKQVGSMLKSHKASMFIIFSICLLCMVESFFHPIVVKKLTDDGMLKRNYPTILLYGITLILLIIVMQGLDILQNWLLLKVRNDVLHKLHMQAFEKLLYLKMSYFTEKNSAEIMNQLNVDIESAGILLDKGFIYMFTYTLRIFSGFIGLFILTGRWLSVSLPVFRLNLYYYRFSARRKKKCIQSISMKTKNFMPGCLTGLQGFVK